MNRRNDHVVVLTLAVLLLLVAGAGRASEEEIAPSSLSVSSGGFSARGYLGEWLLTVDTPDEDQHLVLELVDVDGKVGATIREPAQPQAQVVTDISESSLALKLRYPAQVDETETMMVLIVRLLDAGTLTGSLADELGQLGVDVSDEHRTLGLGQFAARVRGTKGGKIPGQATLSVAGNDVKITYGGLRVGSEDHNRLAGLKDEQVFEFTRSRATKLFTDSDLRFGSVVVKAGNAAPQFPDYPGAYSLWLKKTPGGWSLVFNEEADIWGTQHDPAADVFEVPLTLTTTEEEQARFLVDLQQRQEGGRLRLAWGEKVWTADFVLAQ